MNDFDFYSTFVTYLTPKMIKTTLNRIRKEAGEVKGEEPVRSQCLTQMAEFMEEELKYKFS